MTELETDGLAVDHCARCGGLWFDSGELAKIINAQPTISTATSRAHDGHFRVLPSKNPGLCCRCGSSTLYRGVTKSVPYSWCSSCAGVFLNRRDLPRLFGQFHPRTQPNYPDPHPIGDLLVDLVLSGPKQALLDAVMREIRKTITEELHGQSSSDGNRSHGGSLPP